MKLKYAAISLAAIALLAAGCNNGSNSASNGNMGVSDQSQNTYTPPVTNDQTMNKPTTTPPVMMTATSVAVSLMAQNNSKQIGTAILSSDGSSSTTKVTLNITGEPKGATEPAHIHAGACPNPGAVVYALSNVVSGKSTTVVKASLATLLAQLPLAINVHKSATEISTYVSCGDITNP